MAALDDIGKLPVAEQADAHLEEKKIQKQWQDLHPQQAPAINCQIQTPSNHQSAPVQLQPSSAAQHPPSVPAQINTTNTGLQLTTAYGRPRAACRIASLPPSAASFAGLNNSNATAAPRISRLDAGRYRLVAGMSNIKTRLREAREKLLQRNSATSTAARSIASSAGSDRHHAQAQKSPSLLRKSVSLQKLPKEPASDATDSRAADPRMVRSEVLGTASDSKAGAEEGSTGSLTSSRDRHSRLSAYTRISTTNADAPLPSFALR
jgi:hypothetical protein